MTEWLIYAASGTLMVVAGMGGPEPSPMGAACAALGTMILLGCAYVAGWHFGWWTP